MRYIRRSPRVQGKNNFQKPTTWKKILPTTKRARVNDLPTHLLSPLFTLHILLVSITISALSTTLLSGRDLSQLGEDFSIGGLLLGAEFSTVQPLKISGRRIFHMNTKSSVFFQLKLEK